MSASVPSPTKPALAVRHIAALPRAWHLGSLDAPTVAATWCAAFLGAVGTTHGQALWSPIAFLSLSTWLCYVGDRVLDARSAPAPSLRARHRFYGTLWRDRRAALVATMALAGISSGLLGLKALSLQLLAEYAALTALSVIYFGWVHSGAERSARFVAKELVVGVIFAVGCALPAWTASALPHALLPAAALFGALCWLNCVAIERWETHGALSQQTHPSTRWAGRHLTALLSVGAVASVLLNVHARAHGSAQILGPCLAAAFALLAVLERLHLRLSAEALRILADVALLTPLAWWLVAGLIR